MPSPNGLCFSPDLRTLYVVSSLPDPGQTAPLGFARVFCHNPAGRLIGRIRLPDRCSNVTFGGPKRNELYMCCGPQLFRLRLETQGAGLA
ncbi:SMP-30/gluconolactonase/LRE family protein [Gluconacetobacter diazotrophicus]|uniref:SMP-30/gluconolactonase/LRE family protein n=1 Tax=Gluconacetobacter diazotrophicus TaxID=33996 RepID=UPI00067407EE|nr:SMP-30/gluconolactonase/LRE family protein [Gluconacetobacter diazotrophicus]